MVAEEDKEFKEPKVQLSFPLLIIRTQIFNKIFDKLGTYRFSKAVSWIALAFVPIIAAIGLAMLLLSLYALLSTPAAGEIARELGPLGSLLLPGINPLIPIVYGWVALIIAIAIHEGAHGIAARSLGFRVKSSGLLFILIFPIGAFVDVDEKQIEKAQPKKAARVMAAGIGGNVVVGIICLIGIIAIANGLTPITDGVYALYVEENTPAQEAGLLQNDIFRTIDNMTICYREEITNILDQKNPGDTIQVTVDRGENWNEQFSTVIELGQIEIENETRAYMGVVMIDLQTQEVLNTYTTISPKSITLYMIPPMIGSFNIPFSNFLTTFYTHAVLTQWSRISNLFFWIWFININLAIFNSLPIGPFDGGRIFDITLKSFLKNRLEPKTISNITKAVTYTLVLVIILIIIIPFLT